MAQKRRDRTNFLFFANTAQQFATLATVQQSATLPRMTFHSLPLTVREVKATEAVLERLYNAARLGIKGDALAYKAGLLPVEFRRLCQLDPIAEYAVQKGWADQEAAMATVVQEAAMAGDAKAAMDILKHRHDWVAKQHIQMDNTQQISIVLALEQANKRVDSIPADVVDAVEHQPASRLTTDADAKVHAR